MNNAPANWPYWNAAGVPSGRNLVPRSGSVALVPMPTPAALNDRLITPPGNSVEVCTSDVMMLEGWPSVPAGVLPTIERSCAHQSRA